MKKTDSNKRRCLIAFVGAIATATSGFASAATYSYFLTTSNNQNWTQGSSFAEITMQDVGDDILVQVNLCEPSPDDVACSGGVFSNDLNAAGPNQHTLEMFGFNSALNLTSANISGLTAGWRLRTDNTMAKFGTFDYSLRAGGNADALEPLIFTIMYDGDSISDYTSLLSSKGHLFAGKVSATGSGAFISDVAVSEVPLPGTLGLLGLGLAGLGAVRRKKAA
jgi:hypothetical protein